ncbi:Uncharacterized iron-regulated membrane protein [Pedobacter sp. ok626]|uniref:PepSY-associated TM helix domain-containing protein n=1 Tax=Pedobacter sp. ok626 TaxID=1761882 RepID=UPI0008872EED|nr:PepSY-associated TM helix domain-containing protein [Pedobacter sp. ok626]SDL34818.1 Uncharacterized iron-regulated membrane protein [Pedobacter sp. ok626]
MLKKQIRKLHLWLGLLSGVIVFILGVTGCIYAFADELKPIVYRQKLSVKENGTTLKPLSELWAKAQLSLGKDKTIGRFSTGSKPGDTYQFRAYKDKTGGIWEWDNIVYHQTAYLNPYTAEVIAVEDNTFEFFNVVLMLHCNLLLAGGVGKMITGIATMVFVVLLITGIVLWWPKNKNVAKKRYWFRWKNSTKWKRKNYDLHSISGFYATILALLIALTGLAMAFEWFDRSLQWVANGGVTYESPKQVLSDTTLVTDQPPLDKIFNQVRKNQPNARAYYIYPPGGNPQGVLNVYIDNGRSYRSLIRQYDRHTGRILKTATFDEQHNGEKLSLLNYDIHTGNALGLTGKFLAFFASLISASLPVTGFFIWLGRRKLKP